MKPSPMPTGLAALSLIFVAVSSPAGATVVVDPSGGGDFLEIQPAIDAAAPEEMVLVRPGEYRLTQPLTFRGKDVHLNSDLGSGVTTLHLVGTNFDEARRAVVRFVDGETSKASIEGFTITCDEHFADGIYCNGSSPRIIACTIVANRRGVVALGAGWKPSVEQSRITDSLLKGVWCSLRAFITFTQCSIDQNAGVGIDVSGAVGYESESGAEIDHCAIVRNSNVAPVSLAGGVVCSAATVSIRETIIEGNWASVAGAIYAEDVDLHVTRCMISGNYGSETGAFRLQSDGYITNCLIYGNYGGDAGFLQVTRHSSLLLNCTIASNFSGSGSMMTCGRDANLSTLNCILWANGGDTTICGVRESNIVDAGFIFDPAQGGVVFTTPPYVDNGAYTLPELRFQTIVLAGQERDVPDFIIAPPDFHLTPDSPAIDAGTLQLDPREDYEGNSRPRGLGVDIGAYESGEELTEWIIDNGDPDGHGTWITSGAPEPWGGTSLYSRTAGAEYLWSAVLPTPGSYEVFVWWTAWPSRCTAVPYTVQHVFGSTSLSFDQRAGGGQWHSLGVFSFDRRARVSVRSLGECSTCADAVRIRRVDGPPTQPPIVIDDGSYGGSYAVSYTTSFTGSWQISGAPDPWGMRSLYSKQSGAEYRFAAVFPEAGTWEVFLWWTSYPGRSSSVPIVIDYGDGATTLQVNQLIDGGRWTSLGVYSFRETAEVRVLSLGGSSTCADALKLVRVPGPPPPSPPQTVIVNDGDPGTSFTGTWLVSGGIEPWGGQSLYSKQKGAEYRFPATLPAPGQYEVFLWWTTFSSRLPDVLVTIETASGEKQVYVNQRKDGGRWNSVGIYDFTAQGAVRLRSWEGGTTCADAVSFIPRESP